MNLPVMPFGLSSFTLVQDWVRALAAAIAAGWRVEHKSDGTHHWNWTDITYNAGHFKGDASTWGVDSDDVVTYSYAVLGEVMVLRFRILNTDVGAGNQQLWLDLPAGYAIAGWSFGVLSYSDAGGANDIGVTVAQPDDRYVRLYTRTVANWTNTTADDTDVQGTIVLQVTKD